MKKGRHPQDTDDHPRLNVCGASNKKTVISVQAVIVLEQDLVSGAFSGVPLKHSSPLQCLK